MEVVVDPQVCEANGVCVMTIGEVFELDDEDELHILLPHPPAEYEERVRLAVKSCPKAALSIRE